MSPSPSPTPRDLLTPASTPRQVAIYGTLPIMKPGAAYDFSKDVAARIDASTQDTADQVCEAMGHGLA